MPDPYWQPFWQNVDRQREDTRLNQATSERDRNYGNLIEQQARENQMADQQASQKQALAEYDFVGKGINVIASQPEQLRPSAYNNVASDYQRIFKKALPQGFEQYTPEGFATLQAQHVAQGQESGGSDARYYAQLGAQAWEAKNPGVPYPAEQRQQDLIGYRRAQAPEVYGTTSARNQADLVGKPQIAGAVTTATGEAEAQVAAPVAAAKETGKLGATNNMDLHKSAENAVVNISKIDKLIDQLNNSQAITGMGADLLKQVQRAKTLFGSKIAAIKVEDTETLDAMMGSEVFPLIKALGIGARGMDTPAEREFMRQVLTGSIPLNKATLLNMAQGRKEIAERALQSYNAKVDDGSLDRFFEGTGWTKKRLGETAGDYTQSTDEDLLNF